MPHAHEDAFVRPFKQARRREDASALHCHPTQVSHPHPPHSQARRREDDISIVTAGIHVRLTPTDGAWKVAEATLAFGGLAPTVGPAPKAAAALVGASWDEATVAPRAPR